MSLLSLTRKLDRKRNPCVGQIGGQATDIEIHARELLATRKIIAEIYAERTGQPIEKILADIERDRNMTAVEANEYGLIDAVVERNGRVPHET